MTTITWKNLKSGKPKIQIIKSRDKLNALLQTLKYDSAKRKYYLEEKQGRNKVQLEIVGMSYESEDEKALFQRYGLIPKAEDYPDGN